MLLKLSFEFFIFIVSMRVFGIFTKKGLLRAHLFTQIFFLLLFLSFSIPPFLFYFDPCSKINQFERAQYYFLFLFNVQDSSPY